MSCQPPGPVDQRPSRDSDSAPASSNPSRRGFLITAGLSGVTSGLAGNVKGALTQDQPLAPGGEAVPTATVEFILNGQPRSLQFDTRASLLDTLRESLGLMGTKKGCDHGACGACTVHVDGQRVLSCLTLAATLEGSDVTTIEGIEQDGNLHPLQRRFLECDGYQCGYCTPGQIMSGVACINEGHAGGGDEEIREWMSGNLCRCGAYPNIVDAIKQAAGDMGRRADKDSGGDQ